MRSFHSTWLFLLANLSADPNFDSFPPLPAQFDVLIVGGGAAGLYAALCLPDTLQVGLLTKDTLSLSASDWAQGGIAAAIAPDDSPVLHVEDTLKAGAGLCDRAAVELLVEQAPACIQSLVDMGVAFDRHGGDLALTLEAAHSRRRVLHAADMTGRAVVSQLTAEVLTRPNIRVLPQTFVLDLWLSENGAECQGVQLVFQDRITWLRAGAVVLAAGGGGQVYAQTTNPESSTGDGVAIASRAGALLRDLEFVQFHPTALTLPGAPHFLISEAVRGEGAHLVDQTGHRFAFDYHPQGELAPRDVVSRAIFQHLQATADPATAHVWLDLSSISEETIQRRFPNIIRVCKAWGIDLFHEPIPVAPAAHYWMGGIATDLSSQTTITGLYAVGETASTGVHGANRLASNSLLECLVFGAQLKHITPRPGANESPETSVRQLSSKTLGLEAEDALSHELNQLRQELAALMWKKAGICRNQTDLESAIAQVQTWQHTIQQSPLSQILSQLPQNTDIQLPSLQTSHVIRQWGELQNLLEISLLILKCATFRTESRGGHYRIDYPQTQPSWQTHTLIQDRHCYIR